ncbi:MAG: flap structure-specific endonuclease, partial [Euryarchaeota archaeon]|nr:flap structure-specific endonuclease [Euryarchaeota archaeon]
MGVDLGQLVPHKETELKELAGKTIAIDAYNTLYQFVSIIRQPDGTPLKDSRGRITSHLAGLLYRTANLVEARIRPVFVFDGPPHPLKRETLVERGARKEKAEKEYKEALAEGDIERARTKATQTSRLTPEMVDQAKALVSALGLTYVDAPGEGEAQAVRLVELGRADVVGSQDYDALLFGAPRLVRNLTVTGRRKLPRKQVWVDVIPEAIRLDA